jgi:hypothetical protein
MSCRLCGEYIGSEGTRVAWKSPHNQAKHPEYAAWFKSWSRTFRIVEIVGGTIFTVTLFLSYFYLTPGTIFVWPVVVATLLYVVPFWIVLVRYFGRVSFFKGQWKEQHPFHH